MREPQPHLQKPEAGDPCERVTISVRQLQHWQRLLQQVHIRLGTRETNTIINDLDQVLKRSTPTQ